MKIGDRKKSVQKASESVEQWRVFNEIKVMHPPLKCASMLGHRLRVVNKDTSQSTNQSIRL